MEARLWRCDGEYRWFLFRTSPIAGASGQVVKWCGINTVIENRKRTEQALRAHECRFRSIADDYPTLVAIRTPAGDLEFANRRYREYFDATLEELKGRTTADAVHPDDLPKVMAAWREAVETGLPCTIEFRGRADGVYRWFHTHASLSAIRKGASPFGTRCTLISTIGSGPKPCSPVRTGCSKWSPAATRCREYSKCSVSSLKAPPASVTAPSC